MLRQTLINLVIAAIAETILQRFCVEQVPSLHRIVPRYLRPVTDSSFWPFMLISAPMSLVLLVMIVFFSVPSVARAVGRHRPLLCAQCRSCCWSSSSSSLCPVPLVLLVIIVLFSVPSAARAVGRHRPLLCAQCRSCCWSSSSSSLCPVSLVLLVIIVLFSVPSVARAVGRHRPLLCVECHSISPCLVCLVCR